jgi:hypothetical protein
MFLAVKADGEFASEFDVVVLDKVSQILYSILIRIKLLTLL